MTDSLSTFEMVRKWYRDASSASSDWRREAEEAYDLVAGDQWSEDDKAILEKQNRPPITFNRIGPVIDSICGMEVNNRQQARFIPRGSEDLKVNETLSAIADWARDNSNAEDEESDAFRDCAIPGIGWTETRIDYIANPDGRIVVERVDPLEMFWDSSANKRNVTDAAYVMRVRDIPVDDAREMFPDADDADLNAGWAMLDEGGRLRRGDDADPYNEEDDSEKIRKTGMVRIVECQWRGKEAYYRTVDKKSGKIVSIGEKEYGKVKKDGGKGVKQRREVVYRAFLGRVVLEEGPLNTGGSFTYHAITGKRDRNKNNWYGIVRGMKDPQQYANKWLSQSLHIFNTNAKGGVVVEKDAVSNARDFEDSWAASERVTWVNPGAISAGKIDKKPQAEMPSQLDRMMQFAVSSIRDTSGVNLEMLGMADRAQAGVLEAQRKQSAMTVLAPMFDSLRLYRKQQSRLMLHYIQNFLSDERKIRIVGPEGARVVALTKDLTAGEYDVIVDTAPSAPNQREATWAIMSGMLPTLMKLGLPLQVWEQVLEASPLPSAASDKIKAALQEEQQKPKPPPPEIQKAQMDMQIRQQESQADMQASQQKTQMEMQTAQQKMQMDMQAEMQKSRIEMQIMREKNDAAIQAAREKAENDMEIARMKAENDMMIKRETANIDAENETRKKRIEMGDLPPEEPDARIDMLIDQIGSLTMLLMAPKEIIRDEDGRPAGVRIQGFGDRAVMRGPDGNIAGLQ